LFVLRRPAASVFILRRPVRRLRRADRLRAKQLSSRPTDGLTASRPAIEGFPISNVFARQKSDQPGAQPIIRHYSPAFAHRSATAAAHLVRAGHKAELITGG
jgi:hypothetical protein